MRRVILPVGCWLFLTALVHAQPSDWGAVKNLPAGTMVRLEGSRHGRIQGTFRSADDVQIVIDEDGSPLSPVAVPRQLVRRVERREATVNRRRGAKKGFWIGLAIGVLAAFPAGIEERNALLVQPTFWSTAGALIGAAGASPKYVLVYRQNGP